MKRILQLFALVFAVGTQAQTVNFVTVPTTDGWGPWWINDATSQQQAVLDLGGPFDPAGSANTLGLNATNFTMQASNSLATATAASFLSSSNLTVAATNQAVLTANIYAMLISNVLNAKIDLNSGNETNFTLSTSNLLTVALNAALANVITNQTPNTFVQTATNAFNAATATTATNAVGNGNIFTTSNLQYIAGTILTSVSPTNIIYCDTNGSDSSYVIGDVLHPAQTFGIAISNQPVGGAVVLTSGQTFVVSNIVNVTKSLNLIAIGSFITGTSPTTNFSKIFSFSITNGSCNIVGGRFDNSINWQVGWTQPNYIATWATGASNSVYTFYGVWMESFADIFLQGGIGNNVQLYMVDGCTMATSEDGMKIPMNNTNNCIAVLQNSTLMGVVFPGFASINSIGSIGANSRWLFQNDTITLGDSGGGSTPLVFYSSGSGSVATITGCTVKYTGTNSTFNIINNNTASTWNLYGNPCITNSVAIVENSTGALNVNTNYSLPQAVIPFGLPASTNYVGTFTGTFTGAGGGLTNLNASNLASGTIPQGVLPSIVITNMQASATIQNLNDVSGNTSVSPQSRVLYSSSVIPSVDFGNDILDNLAGVNAMNYSGGTNYFPGTNNFQSVVILTNGNNQISGSFTGNLSGGTNLNIAAGSNVTLTTNAQGQLTIAASGGSGNASTNVSQFWPAAQNLTNAANVISGNGGGLTNLTHVLMVDIPSQTASTAFAAGAVYFPMSFASSSQTTEIYARKQVPFAPFTVTNLQFYEIGLAATLGIGTNLFVAFVVDGGVSNACSLVLTNSGGTGVLSLTNSGTGSFTIANSTSVWDIVVIASNGVTQVATPGIKYGGSYGRLSSGNYY